MAADTSGIPGVRRVSTSGYGPEVVLTIAGTGMQLVAEGEDAGGTTYVRVCDPHGYEVAYWNEDEWREAPSEVMGAVIGALCAVTLGVPERGLSIGASGIPGETPLDTIREQVLEYAEMGRDFPIGGAGGLAQILDIEVE